MREVVDVANRTPDRTRLAPFVVLAAFALLQGLSIARHEMWRDELQAWGVATGTSGLGALGAALREEGHPPLWYLLLRMVGAAWPDPVAMQVLAWSLGVGAGAVILFCAPASLWLRCCVLLGNYVGYEYTVLARSYTLGLLLLVAALAAYTTARPRRGLAAAMVAGLALTSAFGTALAMALAAAMILDARRGREALPRWRRSAPLGAVGVVAVLSLAATVALRTFADNPGLLTDTGLRRRGDLASHGLTGLLPVPDALDVSWGGALLTHVPGSLRLLLLLLLAGALAWALRGDRPAQVLWTTAFLLCLSLTLLTGASGLRHHGHLYLAVLAALWFARRCGAPPRTGRAGRRCTAAEGIGAAVVLTGLIAGVLATVADLRTPFSSAERMAEHLAAALPADAQVVADTDFGTSGVAILLDRPFHRPASGDVGTYVRWAHRTCREDSHAGGCVARDDVVAAAEALTARPGPVWVLTTYPMTDPRLQPVHRVTGGMIAEEDQYAYRLLGAP